MILASKEALSKINIQNHIGNHPRKGSIDLIPIHPITECTNLEDCSKVAINVDKELTSTFPDLQTFKFGAADIPLNRDLVKRRKEIGWFDENTENLTQYGTTGIGAIPYMSNFNVMIECNDILIGNEIAKSVRERNGGLLGVQSMAFTHGENQIEIACNVDLIKFDLKNEFHEKLVKEHKLERCMGNYFITPFDAIQEAIRIKTEESGFCLKGNSVIIGFTPNEAAEITYENLIKGCNWTVGKYRNYHM